jgi:hypothetical protein
MGIIADLRKKVKNFLLTTTDLIGVTSLRQGPVLRQYTES